jgi:hypothetical protein
VASDPASVNRRAVVVRAAQVAGVALVGYIGYGIYAAGLDERPPPPTTTSIVFKNGTATGHRIVSRSWSADYDNIQSNSDQTVLELDNVRNGIIYKKGKPYLRVRANHMSVNTESRDFNVTGPLHVETVDAKPHRSFDTTAAAWDNALQRLTLSKHVTVNTAGSAPLSIGSMTFDVKSGAIDITAIDGPVRFK